MKHILIALVVLFAMAGAVWAGFVRGLVAQPLSQAAPVDSGFAGVGSGALVCPLSGGRFHAGAGAGAAALWFQAGLGTTASAASHAS